MWPFEVILSDVTDKGPIRNKIAWKPTEQGGKAPGPTRGSYEEGNEKFKQKTKLGGLPQGTGNKTLIECNKYTHIGGMDATYMIKIQDIEWDKIDLESF